MSLEMLATFLGWCTIINFAVLALAAIGIVGMRGMIVRIHSRMFGLAEPDLMRAYFRYLANYKIAILTLNLAPYIAVKVMT